MPALFTRELEVTGEKAHKGTALDPHASIIKQTKIPPTKETDKQKTHVTVSTTECKAVPQ